LKNRHWDNCANTYNNKIQEARYKKQEGQKQDTKAGESDNRRGFIDVFNFRLWTFDFRLITQEVKTMQRFIYRGKGTLCLFVTLFALGFFVAPHAREGDTVFAFNLHNLGRVLERMVQLPEDEIGPIGPMGSEHKDKYVRVF
jgi:hypothetical protein